MTRIDYRLDEGVAVLTLNDGENRFNLTFLEDFLDTLNRIEKEADAGALLVTSSHEKIFSNGIDLDWLLPIMKANDTETAMRFFHTQNRLFKRLLLYPMVTVAAMSGHAFAGGAIMSCAFDFRFMRSDRGFFCFPEVDLEIPFLPGMIALIRKAVPEYKMQELHLTGGRITAEECQAHHIVTKACHRKDLLNDALAFAKDQKKRRPVVAEMKKRMYTDIVHAFDVEDPPVIASGVFYV